MNIHAGVVKGRRVEELRVTLTAVRMFSVDGDSYGTRPELVRVDPTWSKISSDRSEIGPGPRNIPPSPSIRQATCRIRMVRRGMERISDI